MRSRTWLLFAVVLGACGPMKPAEPEPVEVWCTGSPVLVVRNHTGYTLELVEYRRGSGGRTVIGMAGPGVSRHAIKPTSDYFYFTRRRPGAVSNGSETSSRYRQEVEFDRECN